jgi:hypothetical protein
VLGGSLHHYFHQTIGIERKMRWSSQFIMLWAVLIMIGLPGCSANKPTSILPTPLSYTTPEREDTSNWPKDWYKNLVIRIYAHLDERQDLEVGHTIVDYEVTTGGYSMNRREVFNWAFQDERWHKIKDEEMVELWALVKGLPAEEENVPADKRLVVEYKDGAQWVRRTYRWDVLPQNFERIYELLGGERFETKRSRGLISR